MSKKILKLGVAFVLILAMQSCAMVGLIQSKKEIKGDFEVELKPKNSFGYYDMSINVIQGIASFEDGFFTSQTSANKYLSINYLNSKGESVFNKRFTVSSHAQDLSLEKISENELYLYTTFGEFNKQRASGILRLKVILPEKIKGKRDMSKIKITIDRQINLKLNNSTPTLNEEKTQFAIRSANSIIIAKKQDVLNNNLSKMVKFNLDSSQLKGINGETLWFQGIAMKDDKVYAMTGNNSLNSLKLIYVYDLHGKVLDKYTIEKNEFGLQLGKKLEPEGLTFVNDKLHYIIIIKGKVGENKKFLFKL